MITEAACIPPVDHAISTMVSFSVCFQPMTSVVVTSSHATISAASAESMCVMVTMIAEMAAMRSASKYSNNYAIFHVIYSNFFPAIAALQVPVSKCSCADLNIETE